MRLGNLEEIFTEDWVNKNNNHPIAVELLNNKLFFNSLFQLEKNLKSIKNCKNANKVIKRLKNGQEYFGALFEIEVAAGLVERGYEIEFQPRLANGRVCDIFIKGRNIFVEAKSLGQSNVERRIFEIVHEIIRAIGLKKNLQIRIKLTSELTKQLEFINSFRLSIQENLLATTKRALAESLRKPVLGGIDRFISLRIRKGKQSLQICGPKISNMEFEKLAEWCIGKASKQLPKNAFGIVAMKFFGSCNQVEKIIQKILKRYHHIAAVLLYRAYYSNSFLHKRKIVRNPVLKGLKLF